MDQSGVSFLNQSLGVVMQNKTAQSLYCCEIRLEREKKGERDERAICEQIEGAPAAAKSLKGQAVCLFAVADSHGARRSRRHPSPLVDGARFFSRYFLSNDLTKTPLIFFKEITLR